jgi:hypothetical protein
MPRSAAMQFPCSQPVTAQAGFSSIFSGCCFTGSSLARSSFANHLCSLLVIAHGNEGAMTQVPGIGPFDEGDLADQIRFYLPTLVHFLCG